MVCTARTHAECDCTCLREQCGGEEGEFGEVAWSHAVRYCWYGACTRGKEERQRGWEQG